MILTLTILKFTLKLMLIFKVKVKLKVQFTLIHVYARQILLSKEYVSSSISILLYDHFFFMIKFIKFVDFIKITVSSGLECNTRGLHQCNMRGYCTVSGLTTKVLFLVHFAITCSKYMAEYKKRVVRGYLFYLVQKRLNIPID